MLCPSTLLWGARRPWGTYSLLGRWAVNRDMVLQTAESVWRRQWCDGGDTGLLRLLAVQEEVSFAVNVCEESVPPSARRPAVPGRGKWGPLKWHKPLCSESVRLRELERSGGGAKNSTSPAGTVRLPRGCRGADFGFWVVFKPLHNSQTLFQKVN